jgi:hypothetical protein
MRRFSLSSNGKSLLLNKAADLLIVVVGVTIAFQLSSLKQRSDQASLERFNLESLANDLDRDHFSTRWKFRYPWEHRPY